MKTKEYYRNDICKSIYKGHDLDYFRNLEGETLIANSSPNNVRAIVLSPDGYAIYLHTDSDLANPSIKKKVPFNEKVYDSLTNDRLLSILSRPRVCSNLEEIILLTHSSVVPDITLNTQEVEKIKELTMHLKKLRSAIAIKQPVSIESFLETSYNAMKTLNKTMFTDVIDKIQIESVYIFNNESWFTPSYSLRPKIYKVDSDRGTLDKALSKRKLEMDEINSKRKLKKDKNNDSQEEEYKEDEETKRKKKHSSFKEHEKENINTMLNLFELFPNIANNGKTYNKRLFKFVNSNHATMLVQKGFVSLERGTRSAKEYENVISEQIIKNLKKTHLTTKQFDITEQFIPYSHLTEGNKDTEKVKTVANQIVNLVNQGVSYVFPLENSDIDSNLLKQANDILEKDPKLSNKVETHMQDYGKLENNSYVYAKKDVANALAIAEVSSSIISNFSPFLEIDLPKAKTTTTINKDFKELNNALSRFIKEHENKELKGEKEKSLKLIEEFKNNSSISKLFEKEGYSTIKSQLENDIKNILETQEEDKIPFALASYTSNVLSADLRKNTARFNYRTSNIKLKDQISLRGTLLTSSQFMSSGTRSDSVNFKEKNNRHFSIYVEYLIQYYSTAQKVAKELK